MSEGDQPLVEFQARGRITIATIKSSSVLSMLNVTRFGKELLDFVRANPRLNLLMNFENVDYLSSAVLTELLKVRNAVEAVEGRLRLCAVSPVIHEVFEITNLDKIFIIHPDGVEADIKRFERQLEVAEEQAVWDKLVP